MAKLVINLGTPETREFELKPGANYIGRGFANDVQIEDASVSSSHAQIVLESDCVIVRDLGSTNGTFVNRSQVKEAYLQPGQLLQLGRVQIIYHGDAVASAIPVALPVAAAVPVAAQAAVIVGQAIPSVPVAPTPPPPPPGVRLSPQSVPALRTAAPAAPPIVTAAAPVAAAVAAHPPAPRTEVYAAPQVGQQPVEPPPGKTACKFHKQTAGQWLCQKCNELFCHLCVMSKRSDQGPIMTCKKCGSACLPVVNRFVAAREKKAVVYSDGVILARSLGFGFGGAVVGALVWTGISWLMQTDVPFIFCPLTAAICGFAVKFGSQDQPGPVFSSIAVGFCILGIVLGKVGMLLVTHLNGVLTPTYLATGGIGLGLSLFVAWKIGGADF